MPETPAPTIRLSVPQATQRAVSFHQRGLLADAEKIYVDILKVEPDHFDAMHLLGVVRHQRGRHAEAVELFERALKRKPDSPEALSNYGLALQALGRAPEALAAYDKALALKPGYPEALANRGHLLADLGRLPEALDSFGRAIMARRDFADALAGRGKVQLRMKRFTDALVSFDRALAIAPRHLDALTNRAGPLYEQKRYAEVVETSNKALAVDPNHAVACYNRGVGLVALGRTAEALASFEQAVARNANYLDAQFSRGNALMELGRLEEALAAFGRTIALDPRHARAYNNYGNVLLTLKRHEEALRFHGQAFAIDPDYGEAYYNRGNVLLEMERIPEALEHYRKALTHAGGIADIPFNEGIALLLLGQLREGFERYEGRFEKREQAPVRRTFEQPPWRGENIEGKTILLHAEQGMGDTIQFIRYAPLLAKMGAKVVIEVQNELKSLLEGVAGVQRAVAREQRLPNFDTHCYFLSLPCAFGTELHSIPADIPYIGAPAARIAKWRDRIPQPGPLRVGVVWSGNPQVKIDARRSIGLPRLAPLFAVEGVEFVSLHREVRREHVAALQSLPILHFGDQLEDFADTAAVISQLDLVISSDTAVAHLAGAMGKPLWLLTAFSPDWRWLLQRQDNPWYPTAKLYRQPRMDDWDSVVARLAQDLRTLAQARGSSPQA